MSVVDLADKLLGAGAVSLCDQGLDVRPVDPAVM